MKHVSTLLFFVCSALFSLAQSTDSLHKTYTSSGTYGMFSVANNVKINNQAPERIIPRFTYIWNSETDYHYNPSKFFGMYAGVGIKNVGMITQTDSLKVKRRNYSVGIPAAIKLGNFSKKFCVYLGGEYEMMFRYKEKHFVHNSKVGKFAEWFSPRTALFAPSLFAGINYKNFNIKYQYYLNNFFNPNFSGQNIISGQMENYQNWNAQLSYITIGFTQNFHGRKNRRISPKLPEIIQPKEDEEYSLLKR